MKKRITNNPQKKDVFDSGRYPAINLGNMLNYLSALYSGIYAFTSREETEYKGRKNTA